MRLFSSHVDDRLSEYIDGRLAPGDVARLESHVATCPECTAQLAGMRRAIAALRSLPEVDAPRSFAINEAMVRPVSTYRPPRWQAIAAPAAGMAVVFVLLLGGDLATSIDSEDDEDVVEDAASEELLQMDALASEEAAGADLAPEEGEQDADRTFTEEQDETTEQPEEESAPLADEDGGATDDSETGETAPAPSPDEETIERLEDVDEDDDTFRLFVRVIEAGLAIGAVALGVLAFRRWRATR
jgi:hypothetical protein